MPIEIKIPAVGESINEVQISEWLKAEGDSVKQDEAIAVVDSEKATLDLPSPQAGKLVKILHQAGETVAVGAVVAHLEAEGETATSKSETPAMPGATAGDKPKAKAEKPEPAPETKAEVKPKPEAEPAAAQSSADEVKSATKEAKPEP